MGYARHAFRGSTWNALMKVVTIGVTAAKYYVLFRLLRPYDFGIAQYVIITLGVLEACTETGINTTIVQSKKPMSYFLDTAWVVSLIRGIVIAILMVIAGFGLGRYLHEPQLPFLMMTGALIPLIKGAINPAIIVLYREFRFFRDSLYRFGLVLVDAAVAIFLAVLTHSAYVFILSMIAAAAVEVCVSFFFFRLRPRFVPIRSRLIEILQNARSLNLSAILSYLGENGDNLLVGKILGTSALGIYSNAYSLSHKFTLQFAKSVQYGTFPVYVELAHQRQRLARAFWRATLFSSSVFVLVSLPFFFVPSLVVRYFAGEQWMAIAPLLPVLAFAGLLQSLIAMSTAVLTATKNYRWLNGTALLNLVAMIAFLSYGSHTAGMWGAVVGLLAARLLTVPFVMYGVVSLLSEEK